MTPLNTLFPLADCMTTFGISFCVIKSALLISSENPKMSLLFAVAGTNIVPVEDDLLVLIDVMSIF